MPDLPTPFGSRILVRLEEVEEKTQGGIILQPDAKMQRLRGTVVAAGKVGYPDDWTGERIDDLVGSTVAFMDFGIPELDGIDGHLIVPEDAIIGYWS